MKRLILPLLAALALPNAVNANVDPEVHKLCLPAADYAGCVKTMTGNSNENRVIIDQGVSLSEGNACPQGYAYMGGGTCQDVLCEVFVAITPPILRNTGNWGCKGLISSRILGSSTTRAFNNPDCPNGEPKIGFNSTCHEKDFALKEINKPKKEINSGTVNINCDSPVWKNKPRCN